MFCLNAYLCTTCVQYPQRPETGVSDPLELELHQLWAVMWMLWIEPGSCGRAVPAFDCGSISPVSPTAWYAVIFISTLAIQECLLCGALAVLGLLCSSDWPPVQRSACLCLSSAGTKGVCHHLWVMFLIELHTKLVVTIGYLNFARRCS